MRRRFTFVREIGREDHFAHSAIAGTRLQPVEANVARPDPVEGRETAHQYEVHAGVGKPLLDHGEIRRRLDHAQQRGIAARRAAQSADFFLGEVVALCAAPYRRHGFGQGLRELVGTVTVVLQELVGHALRRSRPDAGQHPQGFDQPLETLGGRYAVTVQNGSLNPAGRPRPAVMPLIFSAMVASTRCEASLKAAATRSSSISRSSPTSEGSIVTRFTSYLQVICTFTIPAPDWPSTSSAASCSCMRRMFSCICCACFISWPMLPFISGYPAPCCRWWNRRPCRRTGRRGPARTRPRAPHAPLRHAALRARRSRWRPRWRPKPRPPRLSP